MNHDDDNNTPIDDKHLSRLYKAGASQRPSAKLDDAILNESKQVLEHDTTTRRSFIKQWAIPLSTAAVIVISVSLLLIMQQDTPELFTESAYRSDNSPEMAKPTPTPSIEQKAMEPATNQTPESVTLFQQQQGPSVAPPSAAQLADDQPVMESMMSAPAELQEEIQPSRILSSDTAGAARQHHMEKEKRAKSMAGMMAETDRLKSEEQRTTCSLLTETDCLQSEQCTLYKQADTGLYQCREATNRCERGFIQATENPEHCLSKTNCEFTPSRCYCPSDGTCPCRDGEPASCEPLVGTHDW